jgi:hypothetical protein
LPSGQQAIWVYSCTLTLNKEQVLLLQLYKLLNILNN